MKYKLVFSWLSLVLFSIKILCTDIYGESYQNVLGVTIASEEIQCADRIIVYETGIHKADVVITMATELFYILK